MANPAQMKKIKMDIEIIFVYLTILKRVFKLYFTNRN